MNSRKEMIPAPVRHGKSYGRFCKPEWDLLCDIRRMLKKTVSPLVTGKRTAKSTTIVLMKLKGIIAHMDDVFNDWPEVPK